MGFSFNRGCVVLIYVTGSTRLFAKIDIATYTSSTTLELTLLQVLDRSPVPFTRYGALCAMTHELLNSRNYGLNALLHVRGVSIDYEYKLIDFGRAFSI